MFSVCCHFFIFIFIIRLEFYPFHEELYVNVSRRAFFLRKRYICLFAKSHCVALVDVTGLAISYAIAHKSYNMRKWEGRGGGPAIHNVPRLFSTQQLLSQSSLHLVRPHLPQKASQSDA